MSPKPILSAFRQALSEAWAGGAGALLPLGFFAGAAVLVPLGIGTEPGMLRAVGPGILWVSLALSSLVTLERIFQSDVEDGTLDLWLQAGFDLRPGRPRLLLLGGGWRGPLGHGQARGTTYSPDRLAALCANSDFRVHGHAWRGVRRRCTIIACGLDTVRTGGRAICHGCRAALGGGLRG